MGGLPGVDLQFLQEVGDVLALRSVTVTLLQPSPAGGFLPSVPMICKAVSELHSRYASIITHVHKSEKCASCNYRLPLSVFAVGSSCLCGRETRPHGQKMRHYALESSDSSNRARRFLNLVD
jgi:hypothetical protein